MGNCEQKENVSNIYRKEGMEKSPRYGKVEWSGFEDCAALHQVKF